MIEMGFDYQSFTFPEIYLSELQNNILDCGKIKNCGISFRGYHKSCYLINGGRVAWSDNRKEIHFDLPSKSLHYYFKNFGEIVELIDFAIEKKGNISRNDFFIDVEGEHFVSMKVIERAIKNREYVSRAKSKDIYSTGETAYIGSGKSKKMLRIYDKAKESKLKDREITRFEMTHRDKYSNEFSSKLSKAYHSENREDKIQELIASTFRSYCDFVVVKGMNSSRWKQKRWWEKIVGDVEKIKFSDNKIVLPIEKNVDCFKKPVLVNEKFLNFMNETSEDNFIKV